jgi:hypothetical protein
MESGGIKPAGSGRALRLDPFSLPVRYPAIDAAADGFVRQVELHRERAVLRRVVRGMRMAVRIPIPDFLGVALRMVPRAGDDPAAVEIVLRHRDEALSVPLLAAPDADDVVAVWRAWGRVLGLPLLVGEDDGTARDALPRIGSVAVAPPAMRRRRRSAMKKRRPSILLRRKPGRRPWEAVVHSGEREIIARS